MVQSKELGKKFFENLGFKKVAKGVCIAIGLSIVLILFFAVILKFIELDSKFILNVNQIIKTLSILFACLILGKKSNINILNCMLIGLFYSVFAYFIFGLLSGNFNFFNFSLLYNIIFSTLIGFICGVIVKGLK